MMDWNSIELKEKIEELLLDIQQGCKSASIALGEITQESGEKVEVQLKLTTDEIEFHYDT